MSVSFTERLLRALTVLWPGDRLVEVRSWRPGVYRYRGRVEVTWPTILKDRRGGGREGCSPVWDLARLRLLLHCFKVGRSLYDLDPRDLPH